MERMTEKQTGALRDDPVILLGMHHSGTSILARVLHMNGIFMHPTMHHYESKLFTRQVNDRLIFEDESRWAQLPIMSVDEVMQKYDVVKSYLSGRAMKKFIAAGYDGRSRWGFKDPRTCVTLPLFLKLYPRAQLLHIVRNADDVAASLAENVKQGVGQIHDRAHWKALHAAYVQRAREFGRQHSDYLEIRYEDFCLRPVEIMQQVFAFLREPLQNPTKAFLQENIYTHRINIA